MGKTLTIKPGGKGKKPGGKSRVKRGFWREYLLFILVVVGLALLIRIFLVQAFHIPSRSMEDTLLVGDYLLVDKCSFGARIPFTNWRLPDFTDPQPGDLVVFRYPLDPNKSYIKRCLAVAGQTVEIRNKVVYVDGARAIDPPFSKYVDARILSAQVAPRDNFGPETVPQGSIFVMGDNRDNSRDSRHWGMLSREEIIGRAMLIYWSCEPLYGGEVTLVQRLVSLPDRIRWDRIGGIR